MAARGTGASSSARSVSPYRSRSKVRPSASVPANSIAIHRIPAAASSSGSPCLTNAIENTRTQESANKSVVYRISRLFTSIAKSLRNTSNATLRNTLVPHDGAVAGAQTDRGGLVGEKPAVANQRDARDQAVGEIEIVRGDDDDRAVRREAAQPVGDGGHGAIVEAGERLVEQYEP